MAAKQILIVGIVLSMVLCAGCIAPGGDKNDKDSDKDGYADKVDAFPADPKEWKDTDNDTYGDNGDKFPADPKEWKDTDNDTHGDNSDRFPTNSSEWKDSDNDTRGDNSDKFPTDPKEWADADGDGHGDNSDKFPSDPKDWADADGDGHGDNSDKFPTDASEWADTDDDGTGDKSDDFPTDPGLQARLNVSLSGSYYADGKYCVYGMIVNNKTRSVGGIKNTIEVKVTVFIDGAYFKEMGTDTYNDVNLSLAPGGTLPFAIQVDDDQHRGNSHKIEVKTRYYNSTPLNYVTSKNLTGFYDSVQKGYHMDAVVYNPGPSGAYNLKFMVVFYDSQNTIIDARKGFNGEGALGVTESKDIDAWTPAPKADTIDHVKIWFLYDNH